MTETLLSITVGQPGEELSGVLEIGFLVVEDQASLDLSALDLALQNLQVVHDVLDAELLLNI